MLRCLGQRQLDKERCPEAAVPVSKARPLAPYRASVVQWKVTRPAKASPLGRGVTEGDGEGKPGRKEPLRSDRQALCQSCLEAALPSQSRRKLLASSPCRGAFGKKAIHSFPTRRSSDLKRRSFPLCQGLPSVGEVALRSNDGEVEPSSGSRSGLPSYNLSVCFADSSPSRGASGETVHFAGTAKASPR